MRITSARSIALLGLEGYGVDVETHVGHGLVAFTFVDLPDAPFRETKDRVRSALQAVEHEVLDAHITVNLSPVGLLESGSSFSLAVAAAVLKTTEAVHPQTFADTILLAELSLDRGLRPVKGTLPAVTATKQTGARHIIAATADAAETSLIADIEVLGFSHLANVVVQTGGRANKLQLLDPAPMCPRSSTTCRQAPDLADVRGQDTTIDAFEATATGGHHLFLIGEPDTGKTMFASRLPSILPPLEEAIALQTTTIYSLAGILPQDSSLIRTPPFQTPHHSMTIPALAGSGSRVTAPEAVSLAHGGVLLLGETAELSPSVLDSLRQPLEERFVTIHRSKASVRYPSALQLILASNPCPCGHGGRACRCISMQRRRYASRLSDSLFDRIDITVTMRQPTKTDLRSSYQCLSAEIRKRVEGAGARGARRLRDARQKMNSELPGAQIHHPSGIPEHFIEALDRAVNEGIVTIHGADRVLRLIWTLADLHERPLPNDKDLARALILGNGGLNAS